MSNLETTDEKGIPSSSVECKSEDDGVGQVVIVDWTEEEERKLV